MSKNAKPDAKSGSKAGKTGPSPNESSSPTFTQRMVALSNHGDTWWLPLLMLVVSITNSLTSGVFFWCLGISQSVLFPTVVACHGRLGLFLAPFILTLGASVAAIFYIQMMNSTFGIDGGLMNGAAPGEDATEQMRMKTAEFLDSAGIKPEKRGWLDSSLDYAHAYGAFGLFLLQVCPVPIPTAVLVVAAKLAGIADWKSLAVILGSKFCQLVLSASVLQFVLGLNGKDALNRYLRKEILGEDVEEEVGGKEEEKEAKVAEKELEGKAE